jgi:hypothetical protein
VSEAMSGSLSLAEILGVAGFVLGVFNYLRDRAVVKVSVTFDMEEFPAVEGRAPRKYGLVSVVNAGRRPVYVSVVALSMPFEGPAVLKAVASPFWRFTPRVARRLFPVRYNILARSLEGQKLSEGDRPYGQTFSEITHRALEPHANRWNEIRAVAELSTGRQVFSRPAAKMPSWAQVSPAD